MAIDRRRSFTKQPGEIYPIDIEFSEAVPLGSDGIVSATASAVKWPRREPKNESDATSEILFSTDAVILNEHISCGETARFTIQGGIHNYDYKITILATFDNGAILEEEIYVRVREE